MDSSTDRLAERVAEIARRHPGAPAAHTQVSLLGEAVDGGPCCDKGWTEMADGSLVRCRAGCSTPAPKVRVARRASRRSHASWVA